MIRPVYADDYLMRRFDLRAYNCWHLVRDVWRDMTDVDLGDLTPSSLETPALVGAARDASDGPEFVQVERQRTCIVLFERPGTMPHVGIMLRGRVLHLRPDGVRYQLLEAAQLGFRSVTFYWPRGQQEAA